MVKAIVQYSNSNTFTDNVGVYGDMRIDMGITTSLDVVHNYIDKYIIQWRIGDTLLTGSLTIIRLLNYSFFTAYFYH
jgi:hypothetical protein